MLIVKIVGAVVLAAVGILAAMIVLGTADPPPQLTSISEPFRKVDYSDLPPLQETPTVPQSVYTWARPFVPRIIALSILDRLGIHAFGSLPSLAFAVPPGNPYGQTGVYSFRLLQAFGTRDYVADLRSSPRPIAVIVGEKDQLFTAAMFAPTIRAVRPDVPVTVLPELDHIGISTDLRALPAILAAIRSSP
jgi:hypothetical protein